MSIFQTHLLFLTVDDGDCLLDVYDSVMLLLILESAVCIKYHSDTIKPNINDL